MTRRWFFQLGSAVGALFGVKPAIATRMPAVKPKPLVVFNQSIVGHPGYVYSNLWVNVLANEPLQISLGYDGAPPLTTTFVPVGKPFRWIGFSAVDGLDATTPLRLIITGKQAFTVKSVDPHYRWPSNRPGMSGAEFEAEAAKARTEIAAARQKRADDWFISEELKP